MQSKIDFVITWVDGTDTDWLNEKKQYDSNIDILKEKCRYRDMGTLKYWFRAVEKFTPWVNKIYFITWGHIPSWLNTDNEKLVIVNHRDYIPSKYLPTYNSNVIELNIDKIKSLSENFVLFNDDFFIIKPMKSTDFFKNDKPCEEYAENINMPLSYQEYFSHTALNNIGIINSMYNKRAVMKKNIFKYINPKYGFNNIRTIFLLPWKSFSLIYDPHLPVSLKKSYIKRLWDNNHEILDSVSKNKFRKQNDINQYLIRYMQLLDGNFIPRRHGIGKMFSLSTDSKKIVSAIHGKKYKMICINDSSAEFDFDRESSIIIEAFDKLLPQKSSYEK